MSGTAGDLRWVVEAARAADDMKGVDTVVIDVGDVLAVTDYFVITNGTNPRQVRAIVESVEKDLKAAGGPAPVRVEGGEGRQWVLLDYGSFVVHVFDSTMRDFYSLERLWADRPRIEWSELIASDATRGRAGAATAAFRSSDLGR